MSISKWFLKNGFGSPGSAAKFYSKIYNKLPDNKYESWFEKFDFLYELRSKTNLNIGDNLIEQIQKDRILIDSKGELPLFVFMMMYIETSQFRNSVYASEFNFTNTYMSKLRVARVLCPRT